MLPAENTQQVAKPTLHKKNILFYHNTGLSFGGTEKYLQILAKYIDKKKYNVFFMYADEPNAKNNRQEYLLGSHITFIKCTYDTIENRYPFVIINQQPNIFDVIQENKIDLVITAGAGNATFPINLIRNIPIIMISSFGALTTQKNIVNHICVSEEVRKRILPLINIDHTTLLPVQSELPPANVRELGEVIRQKFGIKKNNIVFGRIGRPDNNIFDPIGIEAFKKVLVDHPNAHYIIMAPAPILIEIVKKDNIKNVHFISPSSRETDVWAFHGALDVLAHFRYDGESFGLNIAESMLVGNPIVSHKSPFWNGHLEYLDDSFSRVAEINAVEQYAENMRFMIKKKCENKLSDMGQYAQIKAEKLFYIKNNIHKIEKLLTTTLS